MKAEQGFVDGEAAPQSPASSEDTLVAGQAATPSDSTTTFDQERETAYSRDDGRVTVQALAIVRGGQKVAFCCWCMLPTVVGLVRVSGS